MEVLTQIVRHGGPDKLVITSQQLFQACLLSSAGNTHNLSGIQGLCTPGDFEIRILD